MLKVLRWIIFGAIISILPLLFAYHDLAYTAQEPTLEKIIGRGELLVIVWVLAAGAIGELFGNKRNFRLLQLIAGGWCLLIILAASHAFATITEARAANVRIDESLIVGSSIRLFLLSIVPSIACVAVSELPDG